MKKISVIIPCYNDPIGLEATLNSLKNQSLSEKFFEVIVGNDGGSKEVKRLCNKFNIICIDINPRKGASIARNEAVYKSSCEFLAFTDSDVIVDKHWLENGLKCLENYDYVGGKVVLNIKKYFKIYNYYEYLTVFNNKRNIININYSITANLFIKKNIFLKFGGFDKNFFCGGEDLEFGNRIKDDKNIKFYYCEDAIINHPESESLKNILKKLTRNRESSRFLYKLYPKRFHFLKQGFLKPIKIFLIHPINVLKSRRKINKLVKIKVFFWSFYLGFLDSWNYIKNRARGKKYLDFFK